jgi:hypothetical protein
MWECSCSSRQALRIEHEVAVQPGGNLLRVRVRCLCPIPIEKPGARVGIEFRKPTSLKQVNVCKQAFRD